MRETPAPPFNRPGECAHFGKEQAGWHGGDTYVFIFYLFSICLFFVYLLLLQLQLFGQFSSVQCNARTVAP